MTTTTPTSIGQRAAQRRSSFERLMMERPSWRGRMHWWAFLIAIPAGMFLIVHADHARAKIAAAIYAATLLLVFGTSAAYHRLAHSYRARRIMQRIDHSMIYLLIAGTYAPICLVALPNRWGIPLLSVVGGLGVLGIVVKAAGSPRWQWLGYALYPIMGWCAIFAAPALGEYLTGWQLALVVGGGLAYTIGFPVLLLRRPDPWPKVFGYHEVWHGFTVLAATLHFCAVALLIS